MFLSSLPIEWSLDFLSPPGSSSWSISQAMPRTHPNCLPICCLLDRGPHSRFAKSFHNYHTSFPSISQIQLKFSKPSSFELQPWSQMQARFSTLACWLDYHSLGVPPPKNLGLPIHIFTNSWGICTKLCNSLKHPLRITALISCSHPALKKPSRGFMVLVSSQLQLHIQSLLEIQVRQGQIAN